MASYRHLARIAVLQTLFAHEFRDLKGEPDLDSNIREFASKLKDKTFAQELLAGVLKELTELRRIIQEEAPEWPIERIAPIDRAVLEIGAYEIIHSKDVPPIVAINEAVDLAKGFGDLNSGKFINGVLSTIMHKYRKNEDFTKPISESLNIVP